MTNMVKFDPEKLKRIPKKCILDEDRVCDNCCDCFVCDIDPTKICDNCAKCLELADFNAIDLADILYSENIFKYSKNGKKKVSRTEKAKTAALEDSPKK